MPYYQHIPMQPLPYDPNSGITLPERDALLGLFETLPE